MCVGKFLRKFVLTSMQKQPPWGVPTKSCSENMHQIKGEHPCQSVILIKLQSNFIEITLRHGCSPVNLLYVFRTPFLKKTYGQPLLSMSTKLIFTSKEFFFFRVITIKFYYRLRSSRPMFCKKGVLRCFCVFVRKVFLVGLQLY